MQTRQPTSLDPHRITTVLKGDTTLQRICQKTQQIQAASTLLAQLLPPTLAQYCTVANVQESTITINTQNAAWATQLRYQQAALLQGFQKHTAFKHIYAIKIRVQLPQTTPKKPHRSLRMTQKVGQLIKGAATSIQSSLLKSALLRLAKNGEQASEKQNELKK